MKITENELERLVAGLFGNNLTQGNIEFFDSDDKNLCTRDIDEIIDFDPTHISLETTDNELVGFALPTNEVPKHYPAPSAKGGALWLWFFESPIDSKDFTDETAIFEIPLISYEIIEDNFYLLEDFVKEEEAAQGPTIDKTKKVTFAMAGSAKRGDGDWKNVEGTVKDFIEMLTFHQEGKKDGQCFLQGEIAGNGRSAKAMIKNHFIGFDLDTGETAEEIDSVLIPTGHAYVRYTTHSHLKDESEVKRDAFFRWSEMDATKNVKPEILKQYLIEEKGFVPRVVEKIEIIEDAKVTAEGTTIIIRHAPLPKHRIIFFLNEPFVFQGKANQKEETNAWKEHYNGLGIKLGFTYDKSCTDPARLFYLPRHAKDQPYETRFVDGDYLNLRDYDRIPMRDIITKGSAPVNAFSSAGKALGGASEGLFVNGYNLKRWVMTHDCDIIDLIEEFYPDAIRTPRTNGPGFHIECPFEDEHSSAGGLGTYAINSSDTDNGFHVHCTHNNCAGRNKLDYVKQMVELEWFTVDDLQNERFCPSVVREEKVKEDDKKAEPVDIDALIKGLSANSNKDDVVDVIRKIGRTTDMDSELFDSYINKIGRKTKISKKILSRYIPEKFESEKNEEDKNKILDEMDKKLHEYNKRYAMVDTGSKVVIMDSHKKEMTFTGRDDWKALKANEKVLVNVNQDIRLEPVAKIWSEWEQRRTYEGVTFDPRPNPDPNKFNLFKGFSFTPRKGNWNKLKNHIFEVMCHNNEEHYMWIMTWLAQIVQFPWEKKGSAIVVRGLKGVGKSIVFTFFKDLMGNYGMSSANASHITGQFNWHFRDKLFMIAEEGLFAGNAREDSILKELITGNSLLMEPKGIDAFQMENYIRIAIISNEEWVVNASSDERRYFVVEASDKYKDNLKYFKDIVDQMENGGKEAMMYDLLNFEPPFEEGWDILRRPPRTEALSAQVTQSTPVWERFFITLVENMGIAEEGDLEPIDLEYGRDNYVDPKILRQYYYDSLKTGSARYKADPKTFQKLAETFLLAKWVKLRKKNNELWMKLPPLETIKNHIETKLKIKLDMMNITEE